MLNLTLYKMAILYFQNIWFWHKKKSKSRFFKKKSKSRFFKNKSLKHQFLTISKNEIYSIELYIKYQCTKFQVKILISGCAMTPPKKQVKVMTSLFWIACFNPRTGRGGGQILPSPHVFRRYKKTYGLILTSFSVPDQKWTAHLLKQRNWKLIGNFLN